MDDAGHAAPRARLHREHRPAAALRDEVLLQVLADARSSGRAARSFSVTRWRPLRSSARSLRSRGDALSRRSEPSLRQRGRSLRRAAERGVDRGGELAKQRPVLLARARRARAARRRRCRATCRSAPAASTPPRAACAAASRTSWIPSSGGSAASSRSAIASAVSACRARPRPDRPRARAPARARRAVVGRGRVGDPLRDRRELECDECIGIHATSVGPNPAQPGHEARLYAARPVLPAG